MSLLRLLLQQHFQLITILLVLSAFVILLNLTLQMATAFSATLPLHGSSSQENRLLLPPTRLPPPPSSFLGSTRSLPIRRLNHAHAARRSPVVAVQEIVKEKKPTNPLVCLSLLKTFFTIPTKYLNCRNFTPNYQFMSNALLLRIDFNICKYLIL